jgi:hypothetical protein
VVLPPATRGLVRHPTGDRPGVLAGPVGRDHPIEILDASIEAGAVEQAMSRGTGGDPGAIERAAGGGGQALGDGRLQALTFSGPDDASSVLEPGPDTFGKASQRLRDGVIPRTSHNRQ